jgi:hypothetical protein
MGYFRTSFIMIYYGTEVNMLKIILVYGAIL